MSLSTNQNERLENAHNKLKQQLLPGISKKDIELLIEPKSKSESDAESYFEDKYVEDESVSNWMEYMKSDFNMYEMLTLGHHSTPMHPPRVLVDFFKEFQQTHLVPIKCREVVECLLRLHFLADQLEQIQIEFVSLKEIVDFLCERANKVNQNEDSEEDWNQKTSLHLVLICCFLEQYGTELPEVLSDFLCDVMRKTNESKDQTVLKHMEDYNWSLFDGYEKDFDLFYDLATFLFCPQEHKWTSSYLTEVSSSLHAVLSLKHNDLKKLQKQLGESVENVKDSINSTNDSVCVCGESDSDSDSEEFDVDADADAEYDSGSGGSGGEEGSE